MISLNEAYSVAVTLQSSYKYHEYLVLMRLFLEEKAKSTPDFTTNKDFQHLFHEFYGFSAAYGKVGSDFMDAYFQIFNDVVLEKTSTFHSIFEKVNSAAASYKKRKEGNKPSYEISYSSKLFHTFDDNQPIWDTRLIPPHGASMFAHPHYGGVLNTRFASASCAENEYIKYQQAFSNYRTGLVEPLAGDIDGPTLIKVFNSTVGVTHVYGGYTYAVSDTKKIDFILWAKHYLYPTKKGKPAKIVLQTNPNMELNPIQSTNLTPDPLLTHNPTPTRKIIKEILHKYLPELY